MPTRASAPRLPNTIPALSRSPSWARTRGRRGPAGARRLAQRRLRGREELSREERIGMNEAVFRDVNERIQDVASSFNLTSESLDLICECGDAACVARISLTRDEYERMRGDAQLFAVASGHVAPDVEEVAANHDGYDVVRKSKGVPAEIA